MGMSGAAWSAPAVGPRRCVRATALSFHVMVAARHSRILARLLLGTPITACACSLRCAYARTARATCRCASVERVHGTTWSRAWTEARQLGLRFHFVHACMYTCTLIVAVPTHVQESRICSARCALRAQIAHRESCTNARKQSGVDAVHRHVRGSFFVLAVECLLGVHCRLAQGTSQHDGRQ